MMARKAFFKTPKLNFFFKVWNLKHLPKNKTKQKNKTKDL